MWAEHLDQAIRAEVECRAKPTCMGERIARKLCRGIELRRGLEGQIAEKRRYAAAHGVVSLTELHDLSKEVQSLDAEMAQLRAEHVALLKRPFNGTCR